MKTLNKYFDYIILAFKNLHRRKLRTWLTTLGLVIGIATFFSIYSLSVGMQKTIERNLEKLGRYRVWVLPGKGEFFFQLFYGKYFKEDDAKKIERLRYVSRVIPLKFTTASVIYKKKKIPTFLYSMPREYYPDYIKIGYELREGRVINREDECLLGSAIAKVLKARLYDYIEFENGFKCKIVGIFKETGSRFDDMSIGITNNAMKKYFKVEDVQMFIIRTTKDGDLVSPYLEEKIKKLLGREVTVLSSSQLAESFRMTLGIISMFVLVITVISVVVSSIGIMNTMYMAVTERTREIGLLKAIGMTNKEIIFLFLVESGFIGLVGGMIGIIFGIVLGKIAEYFFSYAGFTAMKCYFSIGMIIMCLIFSFVIGIISGIFPARSAAKLDPSITLRYE